MLTAAWITAAATAVLAIGAIFTALYAAAAFRKQSAELTTLQAQAADQQQTNEKLSAAAELQAEELRASIAEREREAAERRRAQASQVNAWFGSRLTGGTTFYGPDGPRQTVPPLPTWGAIITNESALPILDVAVSFHFIAADSSSSEAWQPAYRGGIPERIRIIPPHAERFNEIPADIKDKIDTCDDNTYVVSIEFTDAAGNRWERDPRGALRAL